MLIYHNIHTSLPTYLSLYLASSLPSFLNKYPLPLFSSSFSFQTHTYTLISILMTLVISIVFVYLPILVIPFPFLFLLPAMITLLKKNIHSFFTIPATPTAKTGGYELQLQHHHPIPSLGLGLVTATRDADRPPNVVESATLKPSPPASPSASASAKRNIGFIDDIGGEVDGLMSCTESLGFESSDERLVDDRIEEEINTKNHNDEDGNSDNNYKVNDDIDWIRRRRESWRKVRSFPPPLRSLNRNGEPSFFLRAVRENGRLELTEVRIHRQEILHASRQDGRLTLRLIPDHSLLEEEEEEEEEVEEEEVEQQQEEKVVQEEEAHEHVEEEEEDNGYEKEEEEKVGEWRFGNDYEGGLRRCHEMVNQQHHHHHQHVQFHGGHHLRMCGISIV